MDVKEFQYKVKFYSQDGSYIDFDGFVIVTDCTEHPENDRDEVSVLAEEEAEKLMIQYDAHSYELTLEDVG